MPGSIKAADVTKKLSDQWQRRMWAGPSDVAWEEGNVEGKLMLFMLDACARLRVLVV